MYQKSSYTKYLLTQEILLFFVSSKKIASYEDILLKILFPKVFIWLSLPIKQKHLSDNPYNFLKITKNRETCNKFCDVERYPTVIWTCHHPTSGLKNISSCVTKQRLLVACFLSYKAIMTCLWVVKIVGLRSSLLQL